MDMAPIVNGLNQFAVSSQTLVMLAIVLVIAIAAVLALAVFLGPVNETGREAPDGVARVADGHRRLGDGHRGGRSLRGRRTT